MHLKLLAKNILKLSCKTLVLLLFMFSQTALGYVKFSNKPIEDWDSLLTQSGAEKSYTVQSGDNLYDISRTLFGDPDFWPKIWSFNSKITNPHIIEKGQMIYFSGGTSYSPPKVGISVLEPDSYTYGNRFLSPEIPPANVTKGPITLPDSLPNLFRQTTVEEELNEIKSISAGTRAALQSVRAIEVTSEITQTAPTSVGTIIRVFTGADYAILGDIVYIKVFSGTQVGDELSVYRMKPNWLPLRRSQSAKANLVEWLGRVKIISTADEGYIAEVSYANSIIQTGENLSTRELKKVELPDLISDDILKERISNRTKVIGSHKTAGATVVGENQIVYLNNGSSVGIETGGVYPLYTNFGAVGVHKESKFVPRKIGYVKIANVEKSVSTGVVFNLISEVQSDQIIGL